jgi:serine/threonine protein phosphatase PrpC
VCRVPPVLAMRAAVISETGRRENNEDAVFGSSRLLAVADGVGGEVAGEIASRVAISKLRALTTRPLQRALQDELAATVVDANTALRSVIERRPQLAGMSTTLTTVVLSDDGHYLVANVGDSRTYLWRDGSLRRLTRDQSFVQALIDRGELTESEARSHPQRSVVLDALDGADRPLPSIETVDARDGDRLLLCSDGVSDYVEDADLADALSNLEREAAAAELARLALARGSRDNISAIVADVARADEDAEGWRELLPSGAAG